MRSRPDFRHPELLLRHPEPFLRHPELVSGSLFLNQFQSIRVAQNHKPN